MKISIEVFCLQQVQQEANEVGHIGSKAILFGLQEIWDDAYHNPHRLSNENRMHEEINDMYAAIEVLVEELNTYHSHVSPDFGKPQRSLIDAKKLKIRKYMEYSRSIGRLEPLKHPPYPPYPPPVE